MPLAERAIRADFDDDTIVVFQAYADRIARPAVEAQRFVEPFSRTRMTWIKPSFLWLMERSGWATKPDQERILAVRIRRDRWDAALAEAELSTFHPRLHGDAARWQASLLAAPIRVQWDPERSIRGGKLDVRSIQVGIGRARIDAYADEWIVSIEDLTDLAGRMRRHRDAGDVEAAKRLLPPERPYPVSPGVARRLGMSE